MKQNSFLRPVRDYWTLHVGEKIKWCREPFQAIKLAQQLNRPMFICSGFASCHWCHQLSKRTFSDQRVTDLLAQYYVPLLIDRQVRPDWDSYLMDCAHQSGSAGGWPLLSICSWDGSVIWQGSFMDPEGPNGGLIDVLQALAFSVAKGNQGVNVSAHQQAEIFRPLNLESLAHWTGRYANEEDQRPPAFPQPFRGLVLSECGFQSLSKPLAAKLANSPLVDPLGGLFRYATVQQYRVPHYEKSASLTALWVMWALSIGEGETLDWAFSSLDWISKELLNPNLPLGIAFGLDADSPKGEGAHYRTTKKRLNDLLDDDQQDFWKEFELVDGLLVAKGRLKPWKKVLDLIEQDRTEPIAVDPGARVLDLGLVVAALLWAVKFGRPMSAEEKDLVKRLEKAQSTMADDRAAQILGLWFGSGDRTLTLEARNRWFEEFAVNGQLVRWRKGPDSPPRQLVQSGGDELPSGIEIIGLVDLLLGEADPVVAEKLENIPAFASQLLAKRIKERLQ